MKKQSLHTETSHPTINVIGFGELGNSTIKSISDINLKHIQVQLFSTVESYKPQKETDLLFLIADSTDNYAINQLIKISEINTNLNILTIALLSSLNSNISDNLKNAVDAFLISPSQLEFTQFTLDSIQSITNAVRQKGIIIFDYADLKSFIQNSGYCAIGTGIAEGEDKARKALNQTISSAQLSHLNFKKVSNILIDISPEDINPTDYHTITEALQELLASDTHIKISITANKTLHDEIKISLLCSGIT